MGNNDKGADIHLSGLLKFEDSNSNINSDQMSFMDAPNEDRKLKKSFTGRIIKSEKLNK